VHFRHAEIWDETGLVRVFTICSHPLSRMND
jgi:hypothetical protein